MIDLHCHILPELDDGSQSLEESLTMARMAVNSGVRAMAATPHCMGERAEEVYGTWSLLRQALEETGVPLKLYPGMEIFGTPDTARLLREGKLFTLNGSRYPLIEFAFQSSGEEETLILRSWEKEFPIISPKKAGGNVRQYRKEDIENIRLVYHLVKEKGMTLQGAKQKLKMNRETTIRTTEILDRLKLIREELVSMRKELDYLT